MSVVPGDRLGVYEITALIGAGGMGEVYRARDARLNRDVALKVLPELFAIYGFEDGPAAAFAPSELRRPEEAGPYGRPPHALVLELVEGPTLADRIAQGPIPLDEALPIARQIAEALEAAHEKALEPEVVGAGFSRPDTISPTITSPAATRGGMILGTAAYMSPEQARGKARRIS